MRLGRFAGVGTLLAFALAAAGCGSGASPSPSASASASGSGGKVVVVTSSTVFGDMIANVGGDFVAVTSLVPKNGEVHTFEPRPADMRTVAGADLIVMNGLGLDDWMLEAITEAAPEGTTIVTLGEDLAGVTLLPGEEGEQNPHLWLNVAYAEKYADKIAEGLKAVDAAHAADYDAQNTAYKEKLAELDTWVRDQIATIPEEDRRIVTYHDAFPYYAEAYGITVVGVAVPAPGQEPSAGYIADLIEAIRGNDVKAIFSEAAFPPELAERLADETGTTVVADLYADSLGDPPVTSYDALIRWDTEQLVDALR